MRVARFFAVLETTNSEVNNKTQFKSWRTAYIPDFFVIFFYISLVFFSLFLDLFILILLIVRVSIPLALIFGATMIPHSLCEYYVLRREKHTAIPYITLNAMNFLMYLVGLGSIYTSLKILKKNLGQLSPLRQTICHSYPFFSISSEAFSVIKVYSCIILVFKSIPQLFIASIYILDNCMTGPSSILLLANLLVNMLVFSQTIAAMFPIRKIPRVFTSCSCVILNAGNKFFGTMCACCTHLAVFAMLFKRVKYWAILIHFIKTLIWSWPCWQVLKNQPIPLSLFSFTTYLLFITLVFGFIYIHPFEGQGKLHYYFFYLMAFFFDLAFIYMCSDAKTESITIFLTLRVLMIGFLSCFGLLNIMHKYRDNRFGCGPLECKSIVVLKPRQIGTFHAMKPDQEKFIRVEEFEQNEKSEEYDSKNYTSKHNKFVKKGGMNKKAKNNEPEN